MHALTIAALATAAEPENQPEKTKVGVSGQWSVWGLSQHDFLFGKDHPLNDSAYVVQALRVRGEASKGSYGIVGQIDAAQGWWGVDNNPNDAPVGAVDPVTGAPISVSTYNVDGLFGDKDTNYAVHLDTAYGWFRLGPVQANVGRQPWTYGQRLVLDEDLDSVVMWVEPTAAPVRFQLAWAKVAEGKGAYTTPTGAVMSDTYEGTGDVDLFGARAVLELPGEAGGSVGPDSYHRAELFGLYYIDRISTGESTSLAYTHLPAGLGYAESRFSPNVSNLLAVGLAGDGRRSWFGYKGELDVLTGEDGVDNADHALGQLDRNDGRLFGWNVYAEGTAFVTAGVPLDFGVVGGVGSGDPDVTRGAGNVNKISTQGFFALLNVWEDSVMPDVQGISPQGLGSPVSRGYRELENTSVGIAKVGCKPADRVRVEGAFAYLRATRPIRGFDETGTPTGGSSSNLGWEVDANGSFAVHPNVGLKLLWGWFQPGDAATYLINGNNDDADAAWELKTELGVKL